MNQIPDQEKQKTEPLWQEIKRFKKSKYLWAIALLAVALLGLVVPIIPGILIVIIVLALFKKGWMEKIRNRFRLWKIEDGDRK
jgi:hypothetical protein